MRLRGRARCTWEGRDDRENPCVPAPAHCPYLQTSALHTVTPRSQLKPYRNNLLAPNPSFHLTPRGKSVARPANRTKMFLVNLFDTIGASFRSYSFSRPHQRLDMRRDGAGEPFEMIATFENRDDAALRVSLGNFHEPLRRPGKIRFDKIETAKRIETMRVEAGRDDDQIRAKRVNLGKKSCFHRLPEHHAIVTRGERRIDDIVMLPALVASTGAGEQRHLMRRGIADGAVGPEYFLGSVAVMHVEIEDRHLFGAMRGLRVAGRDRRIVDEAKPHRRGGPGMMARRTHCDKGIFGAAAHDFIDCRRGGADAMADRGKTLRAHHGVGIEMDFSARRRRGFDRVNIVRWVNPQDRRAIDSWRIRPDQRCEALVFEGLRYHPDTVWTFWMTKPGIVIEIRCVAQKKRGHGGQTRGTRGRAAGALGFTGRGSSARILPEMLRAKFEIVTNVRLSGPPHHLWRPKPSVHLATPGKNSFDRGGFGKTAKIYVEPTLDSWFAPARATGPCQNVERELYCSRG